ncbi:hypothetical protein M426DRAFT_23540 [Hypoxylon sp. CI-4A]|nr:hypothetical protein M426DRAFT_23540 [Hypoxylon sp. CI-4A]
MPRPNETVWVEGMKLPRGGRHPAPFFTAIETSKIKGHRNGTVNNPSVTWVFQFPESRELIDETERIVKEQATRFGMSYAWVMMMGHGLSTTPHIEDPRSKILIPRRMMTEEERSVVGGKNPQLWAYGRYPDPSAEYPRAPFNYPKTPFQVKPGSILDGKGFSLAQR